jgi:flavodoxin
MKISVIYSTKTGNTKKIAEVMAEELGVKAQNCAEIKQISKTDLLFIGSGVYAQKMGADLQKLLAGLPAGTAKKAVVFGTVGGQTNAVEAIAKLLKEKGIDVIGTFYCKGQFWWIINHGRPNAQDLKSAREFASGFKSEKNVK